MGDIKKTEGSQLFDLAFRQAAARGQAGALETYAKMGAQIDSDSFEGESALMLAAQAGRLACVSWLAARADLAARDAQGRDAMWLACEAGQAECAKILQSAAKERSVAWGRDQYGRGPLMAAAGSGNRRGAWAAWESLGDGEVDDFGMDAPAWARAQGFEALAQEIESWREKAALDGAMSPMAKSGPARL